MAPYVPIAGRLATLCACHLFFGSLAEDAAECVGKALRVPFCGHRTVVPPQVGIGLQRWAGEEQTAP